MPSIQKVKDMYIESFKELTIFPKIAIPQYLTEKYKAKETDLASFNMHRDYCKDFEDVDLKWLPKDYIKYTNDLSTLLSKIKQRHNQVAMIMAEGVMEWKEANSQENINKEIHQFLDSFYMSRVGIRCLIGQFVALTKASQSASLTLPKHVVGIINTKTNCKKIVLEAVENARFICEQNYGIFSAPKVQFVAKDVEFMYIPSHLHHMVFELVKNSMRAVIEKHGSDNEQSPPIKIIVAEGNEDITIKISDEGGGISRSAIPLLFTYLYTTAKSPLLMEGAVDSMGQAVDLASRSHDHIPAMAGYGYGLPLSRIYAKYFGGDLRLISMEGFGTDAYLHLSRLSNHKEPMV